MNPVLQDYKSDAGFLRTYESALKVHGLTTLEEAVITGHIGAFADKTTREIAHILSDEGKYNSAMEMAYSSIDKDVTPYEEDRQFRGIMGIYQFTAQVARWKKSKQTYCFDEDFIEELAKTDSSISIPSDIFATLPFKSFYLDFSANKNIAEKVGIDGALAQLERVTLADCTKWVLLSTYYRNGESLFVSGQVICNEGRDFTLEELVDNIIDTAKIALDREIDTRLMISLTLQALLYLCSYEPDIHETTASKMSYRKAKQNKKLKKDDLPEREYHVGERFGEAFRKWTKGSLGQGSALTGTSSHKRPHIRRAHWHRYWVGKHGTEERKLIIKWVSECFCGLSENETDDKLDTVNHKVKG